MGKFHFTKEMIFTNHHRTDISLCGQIFFHGRMGTNSYEKWNKKRKGQAICIHCDRVLIPKTHGITHTFLTEIKNPLGYLFEA